MALDFELGSGQTVYLGGGIATLQNIAGCTLMAWVRPESVTAVRCMLAFSIGTNALNSRAAIEQTFLNTWRVASRRLDADVVDTAAIGGTVTAATTKHICGRIDWAGSAIDIFQNGVSVGSGVPVGWGGNSSNTTSQDVEMGCRPSAFSIYDGVLDDVRVYTRALSTAEIETIYAARGHDSIVDGLAHRWKVSELAPGTAASGGGSIRDTMGNQNGSPLGNPVYIDNLVSTGRRRPLAGEG